MHTYCFSTAKWLGERILKLRTALPGFIYRKLTFHRYNLRDLWSLYCVLPLLRSALLPRKLSNKIRRVCSPITSVLNFKHNSLCSRNQGRFVAENLVQRTLHHLFITCCTFLFNAKSCTSRSITRKHQYWCDTKFDIVSEFTLSDLLT